MPFTFLNRTLFAESGELTGWAINGLFLVTLKTQVSPMPKSRGPIVHHNVRPLQGVPISHGKTLAKIV